MKIRLETDSLGEVEVPADRYWGAQTARSLHFFNIGTETMPREMIRALGLVKRAAAEVNRDLNLLPHDLADFIIEAAQEVIDGRLDEHFPLRVWQTGSGTQSNMNANEVIANRAIELAGGVMGSKKPVHPNDHVNLGQSSNDSFPTAMHVAAVEQISNQLLPALDELLATTRAKAKEFERVITTGRTHLMDAVPLTLGQQFGAFATQLGQGIDHIRAGLPELLEIALGGTAVGTGLNAHPEFGARTAARLAELTGHPFVSAADKFAAMAAHDPLVHTSGALNSLAVVLNKMANDIRLLASGPRCGLGELRLPANEPGSSIMPGKVNPTQCEAVTMVAARVMGNHTTITVAGASGILQLNVHKPLMISTLLQSIRLAGDVAESFARHCVAGISPNRERIAANLERSLMLVTALSPRIGYDKAARVAKKALAEGLTLREAAVALGYVDGEEYDLLVNPEKMAGL